MLLLINVLCLVLVIFMAKKVEKIPADNEHEELISTWCGGIVAICVIWILAFIVSISTGIDVSKLSVLDEKISLYEEENQRIEMQMNELTASYMDHEADVFKNMAAESSINIALITPELKSNELVMAQITTYKANNDAIKHLKEKKINGKIARWWLYFGN